MTKNSPFWQSVSELAAMREHIPEERRALSGVRSVFRSEAQDQPLPMENRVTTSMMKDLNQEQTAFELFKVMNEGRKWATSAESFWEWTKEMNFHRGYFRLASYMKESK